MDDLDQYYRLLDLDPGASPEEVKRAWRDLTEVWHPDRFQGDPRMEAKAEEKLKAINQAYEKLGTKFREGAPVSPPTPPPPSPPPKNWAPEQQRQEPLRGKPATTQTTHLTGVRGWLLLLCFGLTVIGPLLTLGGAVELAEVIERASGGFRGYLIASLAAAVVLNLWGFVAGILLWRARASEGRSSWQASCGVWQPWSIRPCLTSHARLDRK